MNANESFVVKISPFISIREVAISHFGYVVQTSYVRTCNKPKVGDVRKLHNFLTPQHVHFVCSRNVQLNLLLTSLVTSDVID